MDEVADRLEDAERFMAAWAEIVKRHDPNPSAAEITSAIALIDLAHSARRIAAALEALTSAGDGHTPRIDWVAGRVIPKI